jgi:homogentisate 1,2-dioxygenase
MLLSSKGCRSAANKAQFKAASAAPPPEMQISKGAIAFMMESSRMFTITDWAWNSKKKHEHDPKMWYVFASSYDNERERLTE